MFLFKIFLIKDMQTEPKHYALILGGIRNS